MPPHPYFALELLSDDTLFDYLHSPIKTRNTLHEWPLSCVQQITCQNNTTHIYKSQTSPSVEAAVYHAVTAPHLLPATIIDNHHLVFPYVRSQNIPGTTIMAQQILTAIASMPASTPVYRRIDTIIAWEHLIAVTTTALHHLVESGRFTKLTPADIDVIEQIAHHPLLHALWHGPIGVVHGDLRVENIILDHTNLYVIDWQRPWYAPTVIDAWMLFTSFNIAHTFPQMTAQLCILCEITWLTEAATTWFPAGQPHYDGQLATLVQRLRL